MPNDTISARLEVLVDGKSRAVREQITQIADLDTNVLIYGETGVGKDFWVDYLAHISRYPRVLNLHCGDVPENLLESEWFGYKQGAFTGAHRDYDGKWKQAEGGILFLNQVDLLGLNLQSRLLRIIERKRYYPLGSGEETAIDARFIFSAGDDIEEKVRGGMFREDLYYRVSAYRLRVPPLRERPKDILPLVNYFARRRGVAVNLGRGAVQLLEHYPWRGNIREVDNFVTGVSVTGGPLTDDHVYGLMGRSEDFFEGVKGADMSLGELEDRYIDYLLHRYRSKVRVAEILGISRKSLYNKLNRRNTGEKTG